MRIAVITPVYVGAATWLAECLKSVQAQTRACTHFLVGDGDFSVESGVADDVSRIILPGSLNDNGNTSRAIGSVYAIAEGFDAIAYLDPDNWLEPTHFEEMVGLHERTDAPVCTAARTLYHLDGTVLGPCREVDGDHFADASSLFITRAAFALTSIWPRIPPALAAIGSRVFWNSLKENGIRKAHTGKATVNFRTNYLAHYKMFGKVPPSGAKHMIVKMSEDGQFLSAEESFDHTTPQENVWVPDAGRAERRPLLSFPPESKVDSLEDNETFSVIAESLSRANTAPSRSAEGGAASTRQRVSLCMIVKNEEQHLADCLRSVSGLFDEMIVVDTGSTDGTRACAEQYGCKVHEFSWVDSFAAARNESMRHAGGEWIFWLDADERLDDTNAAKIRELIASLPAAQNNAYLMCQRSTPERATGVIGVVDQVRLFRNLPRVRWNYRVHEQILADLASNGAKALKTDIAIDHIGYEDRETRKKKQSRNERLLRLELEEKPTDGFVFFNLANTAIDDGRFEEAHDFLKKSLQFSPASASYLAKAFFLLTCCCVSLGRRQAALDYCREGKKRFPKAVELWFQEGNLWLAKNDFAKARDCFEHILELPVSHNFAGFDPDIAGCRTHHNLAFIYRRNGQQKKAEDHWLLATNKSPNFEPAWLGLLELYLEQKKVMDAQRLIGRLEGTPNDERIAPGLKARLKLQHGEVPAARGILEEALERRPKSVWLRTLLADILQRVGNDPEGAARHLRTVLEHSPNDEQARNKLAQLVAGPKAS